MIKIKSIVNHEERNQTVVAIAMKIILVYSAKKRRAKSPLSYSTLNPETSSDSPSAKSKGARFVSAKDLANQIANKGKTKKEEGGV